MQAACSPFAGASPNRAVAAPTRPLPAPSPGRMRGVCVRRRLRGPRPRLCTGTAAASPRPPCHDHRAHPLVRPGVGARTWTSRASYSQHAHTRRNTAVKQPGQHRRAAGSDGTQSPHASRPGWCAFYQNSLQAGCDTACTARPALRSTPAAQTPPAHCGSRHSGVVASVSTVTAGHLQIGVVWKKPCSWARRSAGSTS